MPLASAGSKSDSDWEGVNPWWYVYASVTGYYSGNPATFYDADYNSWAYACGWPICWKTAADTLDNNFNSYHAWSHCTGHFYSPAEGYWDCRVDADVYAPDPY